MSVLTRGDPATRLALGALRRALAALDPRFRRDLHTVVADPGAVGAAGLVAGSYSACADRPERLVCPATGVLLLRGETTWADLARCARLDRFDRLHAAPSWTAELEDLNDALDALVVAAGLTSLQVHPPATLAGLLEWLLVEVDGGRVS
jgi:hypothetical protein